MLIQGEMMAESRALRSEREFHFTTKYFDRVRKLIFAHARIFLNDSKQELVNNRLPRRLSNTRIAIFSACLALLESDDRCWLRLPMKSHTRWA